jgi:hypothetical protein
MSNEVDNAALDAKIIAAESGAGILAELERFLGRFVAYSSEHARIAHVLWIAHCHRMDAWHTTPRLAFMSAERESGKTRALEATELLVPGGILSFSISPAALVRRVAEGRVTILYDEIDGLFGTAAREEANVDVRSVLNGGYRRGSKVYRCVTIGKKIIVEALGAFAPVALAGLRKLPDTLASRSIIVRMRRRAPDEHVEPWRERHVKPQAEPIYRGLAGWCEGIDLTHVEPDMPPGIIDRAAECWEPLLAIADAADGSWPERGRQAAVSLTTGARDDLVSPGVELLAHIRDAFGAEQALPTEQLLQRLHERPESPWRDMRGKPLGDRGLARRLKPFDIQSKVIRRAGRTPHGYTAEQFYEAWRRYLPQAQQAQQVQQVSDCNGLGVADVADVAEKPTRSFPVDICAHCRKAGAELTAFAGDDAVSLHRTCLDTWRHGLDLDILPKS